VVLEPSSALREGPVGTPRDRPVRRDLGASRTTPLPNTVYVTFDTRHPNILLGDDLHAKYPEYITLVLQNAFREPQAREGGASVILAFSGIERTIAIPYEALRVIRIPEIGVSIHIEPPSTPN